MKIWQSFLYIENKFKTCKTQITLPNIYTPSPQLQYPPNTPTTQPKYIKMHIKKRYNYQYEYNTTNSSNTTTVSRLTTNYTTNINNIMITYIKQPVKNEPSVRDKD